ncbi:MAG: helicase DnaB [Cyanobium sp.]
MPPAAAPRRLRLSLVAALLALATPLTLWRTTGAGGSAAIASSQPSAEPELSRYHDDLRPDPLAFTASELRELKRRFGVHGPQPTLAQLFTEGLDQLQPLRAHTLSRLEELRPVILSESRRQRINPMLVTAVLFDELQHAKPGEDTALVAGTGLFQTHGPAQLSVGELQKQGLLPQDATPEQINAARLQLLDPERNVQVLVGKFARLSRTLGFPRQRPLIASSSTGDAKRLATLAYLHNGKLDYPGRILRYMQNPELHGLLYGSRRTSTSPLI